MSGTYLDLIIKGNKSKRVKASLVDDLSFVIINSELIAELGLQETPYTVQLSILNKGKELSKLYLAEVYFEGKSIPVFVAEVNVPTPLFGSNLIKTFDKNYLVTRFELGFNEVMSNRQKLLIFTFGCVLYSLFLTWIFKITSIDLFIFLTFIF